MTGLPSLLRPLRAITLQSCKKDIEAYIGRFTQAFHGLTIVHSFTEAEIAWLDAKAAALFIRNLNRASKIRSNVNDKSTLSCARLSVVVQELRDAEAHLGCAVVGGPRPAHRKSQDWSRIRKRFHRRLSKITLRSFNYNFGVYVEAFRCSVIDFADQTGGRGKSTTLRMDYRALFAQFLRQIDDDNLASMKGAEDKRLLTGDDVQSLSSFLRALTRVERHAAASS